MDTTIRNLDEKAYRALKARAALEGRTIGDMINEAIWTLLKGSGPRKTRSLRDLCPEVYLAENDHLSERIDGILSGDEP